MQTNFAAVGSAEMEKRNTTVLISTIRVPVYWRSLRGWLR